jgi:signal transduction histidine kinase
MRERAAAIAGTIDWSSRPGEGTRLRVTAPIGAGLPAGVA